MITTVGLESISNIIGASGTVPGFIGIGSGTTAAAIGDTALEYETDRNAVTSTDITLSKTTTWIADFSSTEISGLTFTEFGLFNSGAGGDMFHRQVVGSIAFEGDRELQVQTTFKFF